MQIVTGRRGEPHVTSRQMQAVYRSFLGDFALLDIGEKLRAEAYSDDIVRVYDGVVSVQGIYAVIAYNQYDEVYIEPVSVGKKRIDTIVLHYTKDNALDVEDMQLDVVQGEEYTDNPIAPVVPEGGDAWEGTTDIQVPIYDVEVTNFGLTVTPHARMLTVIPTLDSIAERIPDTVVTGVKGDSEVLYRDGDVNITKANIGLGNVDNTADTDKPISTATQTALAGKVDKVAGKGLSTEDYTTTDKTKLAGISEGATQTIANPADTATETLSKVEIEGTVYDIPQGASGATELSELTDVNLSNVEDNDILQYDETANKWKNSNALQGAKTTTGNPLTIEDAAPVNAVNLSMDLEPIQDLHGYDHPWVGGAGKNLLKMTLTNLKSFNTTGTWNENTYTYNGIAYTPVLDSDGNVTGIKANGTSSDTSTFVLDSELSASENCILSGGKSIDTAIQTRFTTQPFDWNPDNGSGTTLDMTRPRFIFIYISANSTLNNEIFKPMARLQSITDPTFAPYTNICPISGRSEETIQRVGKNLCPIEKLGSIGSEHFILNSGNYTFSFRLLGTAKYSTSKIKLMDVNGNSFGAVSIYNQSNYTAQFNLASITEIYVVPENVNMDSSGYCADNIQIELGTTATTYEPYKGKTYTIQIGQTVYGCHHDVTRGKMVVDKKLYDLGDFSYGILNNVFYTGSSSDKKPGTTNVISSQYRTVDVSIEAEMPDGSIRGRFDSVIFIRDDRYTTASDFKAAMSGVQVCYEIKEPFTIDLTPQQIKLLENTNTIYTDYDGDIITLEYQPNNAIGEAVRAVEESYDPEFAVRPPLKKKAFSGTTDSDGAVTLINASDIPSGHKIIPLHITDMTIDGNAGTYFVEYEPYNSGDSVKGYCYFYMSGSQMFPVGKAITGNFYYYELEG